MGFIRRRITRLLSSAAPTGINRKEDIQMQDNEQLAAGAASDLNAKLDSLLATAQDYLSSQKEGRFAPCNPDFLIKNLAEEAKRLQEYEKRLLWLAGFIADKDKIKELERLLKDCADELSLNIAYCKNAPTIKNRAWQLHDKIRNVIGED